MDSELANWFDTQFPWRGSFPQFLNAALARFKDEWGDRESPHEVMEKAMAGFANRYL